jgi:hypothetical protein
MDAGCWLHVRTSKVAVHSLTRRPSVQHISSIRATIKSTPSVQRICSTKDRHQFSGAEGGGGGGAAVG